MPGGSGTNPHNVSSLAWVQLPRVDNLGSPDKYGGFPKPDSNIQVGPGLPIGALLPGTVTNVDTSSSYGNVVTIKLDTPINSLATHTAYLHLGQVSVSQGQHVNVGDVIGVSGAPSDKQPAPLGFALYSGDQYGHGSAWGNMTVANLTGSGLLNPVPLLDKAKGIANGPQGQSQGAFSALQQQYQPASTNCGPLDIGCIVNQFWTTKLQPGLVSFGEHIAIFVIALILIFVGALLVGFKPAENAVNKVTDSKVAKAAMLA